MHTFKNTNDHTEFLNDVSQRIENLISSDLILNDLSHNISSNDLKMSIALFYGQAMKLYVQRDTVKIPVIVKLDATVLELEKAVQVKTLQYLRCNSYEGLEFINFKYFWKTYCLSFQDQLLLDKHKSLHHHYGLKNKNVLTYVKRRKVNFLL